MQTAIQNKFRSIDLPLRMAESPREFSSRIQDRVASTLFMIDVRTRRGRIRPPEYVLLYNDPDLRRTHEEVGELVRAIRRGERDNLEEEFADVYAWLATLASMHGLRLDEIGHKKYGEGCPKCHATPCAC